MIYIPSFVLLMIGAILVYQSFVRRRHPILLIGLALMTIGVGIFVVIANESYRVDQAAIRHAQTQPHSVQKP